MKAIQLEKRIFAESIHLYHFAGVLTVGVGDSLAAIVGSRYGTHHWSGSAKSKEGTVTMALSQFVFGLINRETVIEHKVPFPCNMVLVHH
ncbi:unnamed protein product [Toxocara canis]|uniref:dolichol kinase n=1 Tax=Toxocara canis TaxID=6265 RepID=A0A183U8T6_TOXCA|nr:unnamed protein product [Toxocara canis]